MPQLIESYDGTVNATTYGHPCLSQPMELVPTIPPEVMAGLLPFFQAMGLSADVTESEDCTLHGDTASLLFTPLTSKLSRTGLNLNIVRPANVSADAKLPVLFVSLYLSQRETRSYSPISAAVDPRRSVRIRLKRHVSCASMCMWYDCAEGL